MIIVRTSLLLASTGLLVLGLLSGNEPSEIAGAIVFIMFHLLGLSEDYKRAKLYRAKKWNPNDKRNTARLLVLRFGQGITLAGLVLCVCQRTSGMIMWIGTIICYITSGWIAQYVGGIPLRMWYGGWQIDNRRRR